MKGLLLKDWYVACRSCRLYFGLIALMTVASLFVDTGMAYLLYPILFAGMIPVFVLSVEEKTGWERFAATLPVPRRTIVAEKYIVSLITIGAVVLLMGLLWAARLMLAGVGTLHGLDWYGLARMLVQLMCFGCVYPILTLPAMFRFGVEKGRLVIIALAMLAAVGFIGLQLRVTDLSGTDVAGALGWHVPALLGITAALFILSWLLATWLYKTRQFK